MIQPTNSRLQGTVGPMTTYDLVSKHSISKVRWLQEYDNNKNTHSLGGYEYIMHPQQSFFSL